MSDSTHHWTTNGTFVWFTDDRQEIYKRGHELCIEIPERYRDKASLISAAPDLLAALKEVADDLAARIENDFNAVKRHPAMQRQYDRDMVPVEAARAAIAKATGENT